MGVAVSIVSAVLKSVVGDKLGSGLAKDLIDISIDGVSEKGLNEITDFINREKSKIDNILSRENMKSMNIPEEYIDFVVAEIKELLSKIDITDEVFRRCKYNNMILKDFMWEEYVAFRNKSNHIECESEIKTCIFALVEVLNNAMRESEDFSNKMLIQISNAADDANAGLQKISEYLNSNFGKLSVDNQAILEILQMILEQNQQAGTKNQSKKKITENRTQEYANDWEENKIGKHEKLLHDLQTICIGCNKKWMDSVFGIPVFTNTDGITNEEVYITDIALIRAFFKIDSNSCVMFFMTQTTEKTIPFMPTLSNTYFNTIGDKKELGTLSYDEIKYSGHELFVAYGYFTNGSGRTFYGEGYDPFVAYLYPTYYASLDYGINSPWNMMGDIYDAEFSEEEIAYYENLNCDDGLNKSKYFLSHRSEYYPNTYGVSSLDADYTFDKLMDYNTFDSIQTAYR